ncbi:MAG: hypothetical protein WC655_06050 [Candidatus Hydrogenedentales bacterium]
MAIRAGVFSGTRVLVFPEATRVGQLYTRPTTLTGGQDSIRANEGWTYVGVARGRVVLPASTELMLRVRQRDLSFLRGMSADAFWMLDCAGLGLTDQEAESLKFSAQLHALNLARNPALTDRCLAHLTGHESLEWLCLDGTAVSRDVVSANALGRRPNLTFFSANGSRFENGGVVHLLECSKLRVLQLDRTMLTKAGTPNLRYFRNLETLSLADTRVGNKVVWSLWNMSKLQNLNLSGTLTKDADLHYLPMLPRIRFLNLDRTEVTNACVSSLLACRRLEQVSVNGTGITAVGLPGKHQRTQPRIVNARDGETQPRDLGSISRQIAESI